MKKIIALLVACTMLFTIAFALPINRSVTPRTGLLHRSVTVNAGDSWTSSKYEIPGEANYVHLDIDLMDGGDVTAELYGSNALSTAGIKVGTISTAGTNYISVKHNYSYYHVKVINSSSSSSTCYVMLYT